MIVSCDLDQGIIYYTILTSFRSFTQLCLHSYVFKYIYKATICDSRIFILFRYNEHVRHIFSFVFKTFYQVLYTLVSFHAIGIKTLAYIEDSAKT